MALEGWEFQPVRWAGPLGRFAGPVRQNAYFSFPFLGFYPLTGRWQRNFDVVNWFNLCELTEVGPAQLEPVGL
ncbi:MAG: hypothetical protein ACKO0N_15210 [Planctomycetota bacterium]